MGLFELHRDVLISTKETSGYYNRLLEGIKQGLVAPNEEAVYYTATMMLKWSTQRGTRTSSAIWTHDHASKMPNYLVILGPDMLTSIAMRRVSLIQEPPFFPRASLWWPLWHDWSSHVFEAIAELKDKRPSVAALFKLLEESVTHTDTRVLNALLRSATAATLYTLRPRGRTYHKSISLNWHHSCHENSIGKPWPLTRYLALSTMLWRGPLGGDYRQSLREIRLWEHPLVQIFEQAEAYKRLWYRAAYHTRRNRIRRSNHPLMRCWAPWQGFIGGATNGAVQAMTYRLESSRLLGSYRRREELSQVFSSESCGSFETFNKEVTVIQYLAARALAMAGKHTGI